MYIYIYILYYNYTNCWCTFCLDSVLWWWWYTCIYGKVSINSIILQVRSIMFIQRASCPGRACLACCVLCAAGPVVGLLWVVVLVKASLFVTIHVLL